MPERREQNAWPHDRQALTDMGHTQLIPIDAPDMVGNWDGVLGRAHNPDYLVGEDREPAPRLPAMPGGFAGEHTPYHSGGVPPTPDSMAFYFPFHYFYPRWWGIYIIYEERNAFARRLIMASGKRKLSSIAALDAARIFLYRHEYYHHRVEAFATRLEVTHRVPLFKTGFERLYQYQHINCLDGRLEESLATAYAYQEVKKAFHKHREQDKVLSALDTEIRRLPKGYNQAVQYYRPKPEFDQGQNAFAEMNQQEALPAIKSSRPDLWAMFQHDFTGFATIKSRINYVVHKDSTLAGRERLR